MLGVGNVVPLSLLSPCKIQAKLSKHSPWSKLDEQRATHHKRTIRNKSRLHLLRWHHLSYSFPEALCSKQC
jgi:hypothetical protein